MKVKFANGVVKNCTAPTEQKIFRSTEGVGWILILKLVGEITSDELDSFLTAENISKLMFSVETENGEDKTVFSLDGYNKITSSAIRYSEDTTATLTEIQLTKGI
jgi:hypothetical protein